MVFGSPTFWRFLRYARPYWAAILGSIVCGVLKFSLALLVPYSLGYMFDHVILPAIEDPERIRRLMVLAGLLLLAFLARIPISYYRSYLAEWAGNRTIFDIRQDLYAHVQRLSLSFHSRQRTGSTTSRIINDVNTAQGILDRGVMSVGVDAIFLIGVVAFLLLWEFQLALASLCTLPMYAIVFGVLNPRLRVAARAAQQQMSELSGEVSEKIQGQPVVLAYVRERTERINFFRQHRRYFNEVLKQVRIQVTMFQVGEFFTMIGPLIVICYGTWLVVQKSITPGELIIFNGFLAHLYLPTRRLADASAAVQMQLAGMDRVFEMMDVEREIQDAPNATTLAPHEGAIEFDNVCFGYEPDQPVLNRLSLRVEAGQAVALVGRSGAGKSTLIGLLPRFYDAQSGSIRIDGQDIRTVTLESLRGQIGMVMQDTILFNGTIRDNILYGRRGATEAEMLEAARMAHVDEFAADLPLGYGAMIGERGITLSGGQKQRVSIARAFLRNPRILVLDEATSSLDSHAEQVIQDALEQLMKGRTTLVIAHRLATIFDCDKVAVLDEGRIVQEGTHDELLAIPGPYRSLCEEQFGAVNLARS
ncbi:MAG: ABC transporter ATP-binding protein [Candidatus Hydrogenedentes bacterium]|nr:ABC transporter ATP-binding protein [Candidatus Hydrogenedentota bacterium]